MVVDRIEETGDRFDPVVVDFEDATLAEVTRSLAAMIGRNIVFDATLEGQRVSLIGHHPIPKFQARALLDSLLASRGYALVENVGGAVLEVRALDRASDKLDIVTESENDVRVENRAIGAKDGVLRVGGAYVRLGTASLDWAGYRGAPAVSQGTFELEAGEVTQDGAHSFIFKDGRFSVLTMSGEHLIEVASTAAGNGWTALGVPGEDGYALLLLRRTVAE